MLEDVLNSELLSLSCYSLVVYASAYTILFSNCCQFILSCKLARCRAVLVASQGNVDLGGVTSIPLIIYLLVIFQSMFSMYLLYLL